MNKEYIQLMRLERLMEDTAGYPELSIALIDGPVARNHPDLADAKIIDLYKGGCAHPLSLPCEHATFLAGILCASRRSSAPAICPQCTLIVRPIFSGEEKVTTPKTSMDELGCAIVDCIQRGARIINLSVGLSLPGLQIHGQLARALDLSAQNGVLIIAAAGNHGSVGASALVRHPWVIPVVGCDGMGLPISHTSLGHTISRNGFLAPGLNVTSLKPQGGTATQTGSSVATAFVTGIIALLWSLTPYASAVEIRSILARAHPHRPRTIIPPLLNAQAARMAIGSAFADREISQIRSM